MSSFETTVSGRAVAHPRMTIPISLLKNSRNSEMVRRPRSEAYVVVIITPGSLEKSCHRMRFRWAVALR
jgi:hypothetical protein